MYVVLWVALALIFSFLIFWRFWFLRNPERKIPRGDNIVSPADGKINKIIEGKTKKTTINKGKGKINTLASDVANDYIIVNIVMTPLDVHFQRSPVEGKVLYTRYTRGKFKNAVNDKIALQNENNQVLIEGKQRVKVIQIAGFLARRIKCYVKKGNLVKKGKHIGLINLGSQVSIIMPKVKLKIKEGQRVKAGETRLAEVKK